MKKRILSFALAIILSFGGIMTPSVHANLEGYTEFEDLIMDYYFLPYAGVNDAAVVQGSSTKLSFHSNESLSFGKNDYYCVVIYKGGLDDISNQISQGKELEEMDFFYMNALDYRSKGIMNVEWKPDSRYGVGDYSLVCYVLNSKTNQIYENRKLFWTELHVVKEKRPATAFSVWCLLDDGWVQVSEDSILTTPWHDLYLAILPEPHPSTEGLKWTVSAAPEEIFIQERIQNHFGYCYLDVGDQGIARVSVACGKKTMSFWLKSGTFDESKELQIYRKKTTLCVDGEDQCIVRAKSDDNAYPTAAIWTSSDPNVATVGPNGVVKALKPGKVQITAVAANFRETVEYTVQYHELPEGTPVSTRTATQPGQAVGRCSVCGRNNAVNVYEPAVFTDTVATSWYAPHVDKVYDLGLMNGTGEHTFAPNANVTRAMAATVLWRIAGEPEVEGESPFQDVPEKKYFTHAVIWAEKNGIVNGYPDGTFRPDANITREQLAAILYRYASAEGKAREGDASLDSFPDAASVHNYAKDAMAWAVGAGLINGVGSGGKSYLQPANNATRAQFATIISRYMESVDPIEPEPEPPAYHSAESTDALIAWIKAETAAPTEDAQTFKTFLDAANGAKNLLLVQSAAEEYALEQILVLSGHTYMDYFFGKDDRFEVVVEATGETLAERITQVNAELAEEYEDRQFTKSTGKVNGADADIYFCDGGQYAKKDSEEKEKLAPTAFFECQGSLVCIRGLDSLYDAKWDNAWLELFTFERKDLT